MTSCLAKDEDYTVCAQLGTYSDPFTVVGLAGSLSMTTVNANGSDRARLRGREPPSLGPVALQLGP